MKFPLTIRCRLICYGGWCYDSHGIYRELVCSSGLREVFDLPPDATVVWLVAHKRPAADRVKVEIMPRGFPVRARIDGKPMQITYWAYNWLEKSGTVYIELWYKVTKAATTGNTIGNTILAYA